MKRLSIALSCSAVLLVLAACDRPSSAPGIAKETAAPEAFTHALTEDVSGYYLPAMAVELDDWRLHHLFLGQVADFAEWEGGARNGAFAPIMIEFESLGASAGEGTGGEARRRLRLIPRTYSVSDGTVRFEGSAAKLGRVTFEGRLDQGQLATARRNLGGSEQAVLTGTLKVGDRTFNGVSMRWWAGD